MERCGDFVQWLLPDMSIKILMCLEDPSDLVRVSCVSSSWRQFVIGNGLCKHLCVRRFPEISRVANMVEVKNTITPVVSQPEKPTEWLCQEWDHRVYAFMAQGFSNCTRKGCLIDAILASSTDNYREESILNTLEPSDRVGCRDSYWSSRGESDPTVPETLTYKLISKLCLILEFHENILQTFKLPEPALCISEVLQVELLGRVQRQEMDGQHYICMSHIQVVGRPLLPAFDVESGKWNLKYYPNDNLCHSRTKFSLGESSSPRFRSLGSNLRGWEQMILNTLLGAGAVLLDDSDDEFDV